MAYAYNDWISIESLPARETRLRLHITEVSAKIDADVAKGASSRSTSRVMDYYDRLVAQLEKLTSTNKRGSGSRATWANFNAS